MSAKAISWALCTRANIDTQDMGEQRPCYLYLVEAEWAGTVPLEIPGIWQEIVKVGISESPNARLANFATSCPFPIRLVRTWQLPSRPVAQAIEAYVHESLKRYRTSGEWFLTSAVAVMCTVEYELLDYYAEKCGWGIEGCVPHLLQAGISADHLPDLIGSQYGEVPACIHNGPAGVQ